MQAQQQFNIALVQRLQQFALFQTQPRTALNMRLQQQRNGAGRLIIKIRLRRAQVCDQPLQQFLLPFTVQIFAFVLQHGLTPVLGTSICTPAFLPQITQFATSTTAAPRALHTTPKNCAQFSRDHP